MFVKVGEALQSINLEPLDGSLEQAFMAQLAENGISNVEPTKYASVEDAVADMKVRSGLTTYLATKFNAANSNRNKIASLDVEETSFAEIIDSFKKTAFELKKVAPKAKDFLYFSAVMMHAAEAAAINDDGSPKLRKDGKEIVVGWNKSNNTWKWESNDPSIKAYKNCFVKDTQILMSNGTMKNIQDVVPGDLVITHEGRPRAVLRTFISDYEGEVLEFHIRNSMTLTATDNHPFYRYSLYKNGVIAKGKHPHELRLNAKITPKYEFVKASEISKKDFLLTPVVNYKICSGLTTDAAKLLGYFAAEGCFAKKYGKLQGVKFTLNINERDTVVEEIKQTALRVFPSCSVKGSKDGKTKNTYTLTITGKGIAKFFKDNVGEYSHLKTLSDEIVFGSQEVKKSFILGWLEGDGHVSATTNQIIGITCSKNMASQINVMLGSLDIVSSLRCKKADGREFQINKNYKPCKLRDIYRIEIGATESKDLLDGNKKLYFKKSLSEKKRANSFVDNKILHTVRSIEKKNYIGKVYNFEVEEDHSYVANGTIVSNCNGDIFPESELILAHKKWVGKPLCIDHKSSSVDHVRGFIVDTFYDKRLKRVIGLCALDRLNYPDLAHKVSTGYSDSVSMGTGVAKAVCYDCGKVARAASEFCDHMKNKSCYGEINVDLNPIELSIVVNGADRKAHIKHIIASVQNLDNFVDIGSNKLEKLASNYSATLHTEDGNGNSKQLSLSSDSLENLKKEIDKAMEELHQVEREVEEVGHNEVLESDDGLSGAPESENSLAPPAARYASSSLEDLRAITTGIEAKLSEMKMSVDKLAHAIQEDSMSDMKKESYYQGTEEPSPGSPKYPVDKMNVDLRTKDRVVSSVVDTGPVDGMYPGDLEKKKMIARAESEERALRRNAVVENAKKALLEKQSYWNGTEEPTPGKAQYPIDKMNVDLRDKDKHMVGQKPFPGVGSVDGLHPSPASADEFDELKRKKMLSRANHNARFIKAANKDGSLNFGKSAWQVFFGNDLILTASVDELTNGRSELLYGSVATKEFGANLINKIKSEGSDRVRSLIKSAQAAPPAAPEMPAAPAPEMPMDMPAAPAGDMGAEAPKDPKAQAIEMAEKVRDLGSDLVEGIGHLQNEQAEMKAGDPEVMPPATASTEIRTLQREREVLNRDLITAMKSAVASLQNHEEELGMIVDYSNRGMTRTASADIFLTLASDGFTSAKASIEDGSKLMAAFVRYARGTQGLLKRAQDEMLDTVTDLDDAPTYVSDEDVERDNLDLATESDAELMRLLDEPSDLGSDESTREYGEEPTREYPSEDESTREYPKDIELDKDLGDVNDATMITGTPEEMKQLEASFSTKAGRQAMRTKLAAGASNVKMSPMIAKFHPKKSNKTELDVAVSNNADVVETGEEVHDAMLALVAKNPKIRKEAEAIQQLVVEGSIDPATDFPALIAEGLDKDAVKYWKQYWGQAKDGGSEFASELVKEHVKASLETELDTYRVKIARSYELANDMAARGLVHASSEALASQVDEIMKLDDSGFNTLKRVVAKNAIISKTAGRMPSVGITDSFAEVVKVASADDLVSELSQALSSTTRKMF